MPQHHEIIVLAPTGDASESFLPDQQLAALDTLRHLVGGPIEVVPLPGRKYLVINEEAKDFPHFINTTATELAQAAESILPNDYIAGTAVIVDTTVLE